MGLGTRSEPTSSNPGIVMLCSPSTVWNGIGTSLGGKRLPISELSMAGISGEDIPERLRVRLAGSLIEIDADGPVPQRTSDEHGFGCHQPARARRQDPADLRPLRPAYPPPFPPPPAGEGKGRLGRGRGRGHGPGRPLA